MKLVLTCFDDQIKIMVFGALKINLFSWTDMKASTLDLETWFLEVFKHILNLPKYKYSAFCQMISQLHKVVTYVPNK